MKEKGGGREKYSHHGQALYISPGHHLVAVGEADLELSHSHHLLLWVVG